MGRESRWGRPAATPQQDGTVDWREARDALRVEVGRVAALLRSVSDPQAPALGAWTLADVAVHLSQAWIAVPGLARDDLSDVYEVLPEARGRAGDSLITDMWDLGAFTVEAVRAEPQRDPRVMADRIEERAAAFLDWLDESRIGGSHAWLVEGMQVPTTTLICHLLNETIVHGWDIAHAEGRPWPIDRRHAALVIDGFLVPVISRADSRAMVDQVAGRGVRAAYRIRIRGGHDHTFAFEDGTLRVDRPGASRPHCTISADPAAFLLVAWGRRSQWPAIMRGQLLAWGRKPWLGFRFRGLMRNP